MEVLNTDPEDFQLASDYVMGSNMGKRTACEEDLPPAKQSKAASSGKNITNELHINHGNQRSLSSDSGNQDSSTSSLINQGPPTTNNIAQLKSGYESNKLFRYNNLDNGPYFLMLESTANNGSIGRLHKMSIGKIIFDNFKNESNDIVNITSVGQNRIKVEMKTYKTVNSILESSRLNANSLPGFIPETTLFRKGVVRQVDTKLTENEIISVIKSSVAINSIRRITRKSESEDVSARVNTATVVITFRGQFLPDYVSIYGARCSVTPYVHRVTQCQNCLRFGHVFSQCKSSPRCCNCGENHKADNCNKDIFSCVSCEGNHKATDKNCPEYIDQLSIKKFMAYNSVGFKEAKNKHKQYSTVTATPISLGDPKEFPTLTTSNCFQALSSIQPEISTPITYNYTPFSPPRNRNRSNLISHNTSTIVRQTEKDIVLKENDNSFKPNPYPPQPHRIANASSSSSVDILNKICDLIHSSISDALSGKAAPSSQIRDRIS